MELSKVRKKFPWNLRKDALCILLVGMPALLFTAYLVAAINDLVDDEPKPSFCERLVAENMSCDYDNDLVPKLGSYYMDYGMTAREAAVKAQQDLNNNRQATRTKGALNEHSTTSNH